MEEHPYKFICISAHGATISYYDDTTNRLLPFVVKNQLDSLQLLSIPPRGCVNITNKNLKNHMIYNIFSVINENIKREENNGLFQEIKFGENDIPLDKLLKDVIYDTYNKKGIPDYFRKGLDITEYYNGLSLSLTDPENIAGFLTTYSWRKNEDMGIMSYSLNEPKAVLTSASNIGIIVLKDTHYFLAPPIFQRSTNRGGLESNAGYLYLINNIKKYPSERKTVAIGKRDVYGSEYNCEEVKIFKNLNRKEIKKKYELNPIFLIKVFIEKENGLVYFKHLQGYNFLSSPIFIEYIRLSREIMEYYTWKLEDGSEQVIPCPRPQIISCNSASIYLLKQLYNESFFGISHSKILDIEEMINQVYNFELNSWFINDGFVSYISSACRGMFPINEPRADAKATELLRDVVMSPRQRLSSSSSSNSGERTWTEWITFQPKRKKYRSNKRNRRVTLALGGTRRRK
jgi:hypothetical protein